MRQFILGANKAYPTDLPLEAGEVGFAYLNDGNPTVTNTGAEIKNIGYIYAADAIGQQSYPIYKNNFSYVKSTYSAGTNYSGDFTLTSVTPGLTYTAIVAKKGIKFNERNKYSAVVLAKDGDSVTSIAKQISDLINANKDFLNVTATPSAGKVTVKGDVKGEDFSIIMADDAMGITVNETHATIPMNDAKAIQDMFIKAAADAGYNSTYDDFIYRNNYPLNPLKVADSADTGFTVFTIKFAEPRTSKTMDVAVNQIIQVAFPTGGSSITTFETVCKALAGITEE